ncbi:MAG: hypothetical protein KAJ75_02045, partial [Alphaproteobacteria bacterium]|nr:hypothetical protein [Alphaproteobacteria bacterium]
MITNQLEQISKITEQISIIDDVRQINKEMTDIMGEVASIKLPITSLKDLESQLRDDASCLIPQMPNFGVSFDDIDSSICDRTKVYHKAFFTDKKEMETMSWKQQMEKRTETRTNIEKFVSDTVTRSLAQTDIQKKTVEQQGKVADQLQKTLDRAKTLQDRAAVSAQVQIAQLRATANQTQLLAQMLKLQTAVALALGVNTEIEPSNVKDEE